jgi:hypothetical protein
MRINRTFIQKLHRGSSLPSVQAAGKSYELIACHGPSGEIAVDPVHAR